MTPNDLPDRLWQGDDAPTRYVILGAGKTAMDVGVWLLSSGADAGQISWVMPRGSWLLNRHHVQPGIENFHATIGAQADQTEALAQATDLDDLYMRLEACGMLARIDPSRVPEMYHCATMSMGEVEILRQIKDVIRLGRVQSIDAAGMALEHGRHEVEPGAIYIDCTATAIARRDPVPVFQDGLVTPQMVRTCQPTYSAALTAYVEVNFDDDARRNQLTNVVPLPDTLPEFLPALLANMMNQYQWSQDENLRRWMRASRLEGFSAMIAGIDRDDHAKREVLNRFKLSAPMAIANLHNLMAQQVTKRAPDLCAVA